MMIITVQVDAPTGQATGIKEDLALYLEKFGNSFRWAISLRINNASEKEVRIDDQR